MPLKQIDTENADRNLTSQVTVLTHTPDASHATLCTGLVCLGDGTKNLDGSGGDFELTVLVGGQTVQPNPQIVTFGTETRSAVWTTIFPVPANAAVLLKVKSPNAGDSDVDVTAYLYEITYALPDVAAGGNSGLALTGADGDTLETLSDQIDAVNTAVASGVAATLQATANVETTGSLISGTYASTYLSNGTYWITAPVSPAIGGFGLNVYLTFAAGVSQYIDSVTIRGYFSATAARYADVFAYNHTTLVWDQLSDAVTRMNHATANGLYTFKLLSQHRKADGTVQIGFRSASTTTGDRLNIDQCLVNVQTAGPSAADIAEAVKMKLINVVYDDGVWIDTTGGGTAGTEVGTNGTYRNPSSTYTDALAIATTLGVKRFYLKPGSSITLTQDHSRWRFVGAGSIALNNQAITEAVFDGVYEVTGTGTGDDAVFRMCGIGTAHIDHAYFYGCFRKGTLTLTAGKDYHFLGCADAVDSGTSVIVFAALANVYLRGDHGGVELQKMATNSECIIDGAGRVILNKTGGDACTGGSLTIRGAYGPPTNAAEFLAAGGTITETSRYSVDHVADGVWDEAIADHSAAGTAGEALAGSYGLYVPGVGDIADAVWNEPLADHDGVGSTGEALAVAAAIDPPTTGEIADAVWDEPQAGHTTTLTFGTFLDAPVSESGGAAAPTAGEIADAVWDEDLSDHDTAGSTGEALAGTYGLTAAAIAEEVWEYEDRTLTIPAAATNDAVDAGELILRRGDTYSGEITDLSNLTGYQEVWFSAKEDYDDADVDALIQITASGGLQILAGETAADPTLGSITVDEAEGTVTLELSADITTALERTPDWTRTPKVYDLQVLTAAGTVVTIAIGTLTVLPDVTRTFAYYGI